MAYADWEELRGILKHWFQTPIPIKVVHKALESLCQNQTQTLAILITASAVGLGEAQRTLAIDREAQALEVNDSIVQNKIASKYELQANIIHTDKDHIIDYKIYLISNKKTVMRLI